MLSLLIFLQVAGTYALLRDPFSPSRSVQHSKRASEGIFPPELTADEAVLVNSFDNVTISQWSYYYTHGLHLAGTNMSMAQWTADRWAENGFESRLYAYGWFLLLFMLPRLHLGLAR